VKKRETYLECYVMLALAVLLCIIGFSPEAFRRFYNNTEAFIPWIILWMFFRIIRLERRLKKMQTSDEESSACTCGTCKVCIGT